MALLNTYTSTNQVVTQGLVVKYSIEQDTITLAGWHTDPDDPGVEIWSEYEKVFYRCKRYATKRYSYVGLDAATAASCAAAKIAKYTRAYSQITITDVTDPDTGETTPTVTSTTSTLCSSDIAPMYEEGSAWRVDIDVNEVDELPSDTAPANVAALFSAANARDYD